MTCRDLVALLIDYVSDELPPEQTEHIRKHLATCPPCVCYVETYHLTIKLTRRLPPVAPPAALLVRLRAAVGHGAE
jgi:anti-sigma factor RsiW